MSRFTRTFNAALQADGTLRTHAAVRAGIAQSVLSRILNNERPVTSDHVRGLLPVLRHREDQEHCLQNFLLDECPADYRDEIVIHFGQLREDKEFTDTLKHQLAKLEEHATSNSDVAQLIKNLASILD